MSTDARTLNEWIRVLPQFSDPMNDYYPGTLWLDTDSGTFGDAKTLVLIDTTEWDADDMGTWECMTDAERGRYGVMLRDYSYHHPGKPLTPTQAGY